MTTQTATYEVLLTGEQLGTLRIALAVARDAASSARDAAAFDLLRRQLGEVLEQHTPVGR